MENLLIVGVGFMGGSLALALKKRGYQGKVLGLDLDKEAIKIALEKGIIDEGLDKLEDLKGKRIDTVVLATPVRAFRSVASSLKPFVGKAIITDIGSVKGKLVLELEEIFGPKFVGGHPIAGREKSGVLHSDPDLFEGKKVILTPTEKTDGVCLEKVKNMWTGVGARVEFMDPFLHDWVFGAVSHLPHAVAFALIDAIEEMSDGVDLFKYPGAGFRDFTRIAGSDPVMWRDIFLENKENLLKAMDVYVKSLEKLKKLVENSQEEDLTDFLAKVSKRRRSLG